MLRRTLAAIVPCCALFLGGCGSLSDLLRLGLPDPVEVTTDDSGADLNVAHGQQLIVRLPVLADSGYAWALREPMSAVVKPEGPPNLDKMQATEVWIFTPVRGGQQQLRFEHRRGVQPDAPAAAVVSYNVSVR